jgi:hypothetical protein
MFFEKKGLCPLGVRPWICVFLKFILNLDGSGSNEYAYHSNNMISIISMAMQTFAFVHCIFSTH